MIYLLLFIVVTGAVGAQYRVTTRHAACVIAAIVLATFAAWRGADVAADFPVYETWYTYRGQDTGFVERTAFLEALYFFINDLFAATGVPFRVFVWVVAFVAIYMKLWVILAYSRQRVAVVTGVLIYCATFYLLHDFTQIRAGIAVGIMYFGIRRLLDGDLVGFGLLLLLAAGFHSSALIFLTLLLPRTGRVSRVIDAALVFTVCVLFGLALRGIAPGAVLMDFLAVFDPRVALYVSFAEKTGAEAANPLSIPALTLFALGLSLLGIERGQHGRRLSMVVGRLGSPTTKRRNTTRPDVDQPRSLAKLSTDRQVMHILRRGIFIGLIFLIAFAPIKEVALRLFEIFVAFMPILGAVVFSRKNFWLPKLLLLGWAGATGFIYMLRAEGLVRPYVVYFL